MQANGKCVRIVFTIFVLWTLFGILSILLIAKQSQVFYNFVSNKNQARPTRLQARHRSSNYVESTHIPNENLFDLPINFNYSIKRSPVKHRIIWYNLPSWKSINRQNDFLQTCKVRNCYVTDDRKYITNASAVIFVPTDERMGDKSPVSRSERNPEQVWIFYSLEPPMNFRYQGYKSPDWLNTMNWSMTYRFDSDILAPYGTFKRRSRVPKRDYRKLFTQKTNMAAWIVSHCGAESQRDDYVTELQKHGVDVDIYGKCSNKGFIKDLNMDNLLNRYKFFIAFENSFCKEYISCKVFRKYNFDSILIVRGGASYSKHMPNDTYVNTADFASVKSLADYLLRLGNDRVRYIRMLKRKDKYEALDEDDFGEKYAMCEMCRKLNNVEQYRRTYESMTDFLEDRQCWYPKDLPANLTKVHKPRNSRIYIK